MIEITATELPRFMICNGSKLLNGVEPLSKTTDIAEEGNAAHWYAEQTYKGVEITEGVQAPNGYYITDEMIDYVRPYVESIKSHATGCVEANTSHNSVKGRADFVGIDGNVLTVADLKYGFSIVEPEDNWTLISHAIAVCLKHPEITEVVFEIHQPRAYHPLGLVRSARMAIAEIHQRYQELIFALNNPSETAVTGSHCKHCKCMTNCPAAQIALMNAVDVSKKAFDAVMSDYDLGLMLDTIDRASDAIKQAKEAYEDLAVARCKKGAIVPNYQVVQRLSNTTWSKNVTADDVFAVTGVDITEKKICTPKQAEKKGVSKEVLELFTQRNVTGDKLVRVKSEKIAEKLFGKGN